MNKENSSYQYEKEEGDVDVRSFEDLKDCFAETNRHGRMEEKALVEAEEPCEFDANDLCLITGCIGGIEVQFLYVVQHFEEDEDEGKTMDIWNVYVLHIYFLILLQVLCKWIAGMVDDEVEIVLRDNMTP